MAFTYIHARNQSDTDTGSNLANLQSFTEDEFDATVPTLSDNYDRLTDNIAITPGVVWITAPNNNNDNKDLVIGAIRTTFSF